MQILSFIAIGQMSAHETAHRIVLQPAAEIQPIIDLMDGMDDDPRIRESTF